jgi:flagellar hook assembly protein FlgD
MTPGEHRITFKAWDVHNNSSERTLDFLVADDAGIALDHVLNYPNPFTTNTAFFFEHNQPCEFLDVRIQVFTVGGKLVKTINERVKQNGFRSDSISWDGTDDFGDRIGKGVYVYRLEVKNEAGQRADKFEKLVILK